MKLELHHINLSTQDVKKLETFYKDILFLDTQSDDLPTLEKKKGYSGDVSFVGDGKVQMHLAQKDLSVNFKTGHSINPVEKGHIAYRTDDIEAFKNHLKEVILVAAIICHIVIWGIHSIQQTTFTQVGKGQGREIPSFWGLDFLYLDWTAPFL